MNEQSPTSAPSVVSVNISPGGIPKTPVEVGEVEAIGLCGDGHDHEKHSTPLQAICLIDLEDLEDLKREGYDVYPGATGENVTCRNLNVDDMQVGDRLRFSGGVELELTKRRKPCYVLDAISPHLKEVVVGRLGFYGRVLTAGQLQAGETIEVVAASISAEPGS